MQCALIFSIIFAALALIVAVLVAAKPIRP
jgi:hypothetical protein